MSRSNPTASRKPASTQPEASRPHYPNYRNDDLTLNRQQAAGFDDFGGHSYGLSYRDDNPNHLQQQPPFGRPQGRTYPHGPSDHDDDPRRGHHQARGGSYTGLAFPYEPSYGDDGLPRPHQQPGGSHDRLYVPSCSSNAKGFSYHVPQRPTSSRPYQSDSYDRSLHLKGDVDSYRDLIPGGKVYKEMVKEAARRDSPRGARKVPEYLEDWEETWRAQGGEPNGQGQGKPHM